jgi:pyruvate dehydrogenase E2 component (dihydrolipoamide acetyltransferase)
MATKVIMPKLSPTMEEGQISRWLKKEGDKVSMGEPLAEIDTDKATMEMQALGNGVLRKILINEGQSAPLGQTIAIVGEPDEDISALLSEAPPAQPQVTEQKETNSPPPVPDVAQPQPQAKAAAAASPVDNGRQPQAAAFEAGRMIVSPLAARMAADAGIDLRSLQGSGPGGRIIKRDIEAAISKPKAAPAPTFIQQAGASAYRDEPASQIRQTIAKRLVTSLGPVPHFFLPSEFVMVRAADMR